MEPACRRFLAFLAIVALVGVGACCTKTLPNGTTTKNPLNCMMAAKTILCNPSEQQKANAQSAVDFLKAVQSFLNSDYLDAALRAKDIFLNVSSAVCVGIDQLGQAISTFDQVVAQVQKANAVRMKAVPMPTVPDLSALRAVLKK